MIHKVASAVWNIMSDFYEESQFFYKWQQFGKIENWTEKDCLPKKQSTLNISKNQIIEI